MDNGQTIYPDRNHHWMIPPIIASQRRTQKVLSCVPKLMRAAQSQKPIALYFDSHINDDSTKKQHQLSLYTTRVLGVRSSGTGVVDKLIGADIVHAGPQCVHVCLHCCSIWKNILEVHTRASSEKDATKHKTRGLQFTSLLHGSSHAEEQ